MAELTEEQIAELRSKIKPYRYSKKFLSDRRMADEIQHYVVKLMCDQHDRKVNKADPYDLSDMD